MNSFYHSNSINEFLISKIYENKTIMENDSDNINFGEYILINSTQNLDLEENGNIYQKISSNNINNFKLICNVQGLPAAPPVILPLTDIIKNQYPDKLKEYSF